MYILIIFSKCKKKQRLIKSIFHFWCVLFKNSPPCKAFKEFISKRITTYTSIQGSNCVS